ncbi:metalloendopeptidase OMA1, mitochondrial-like [Adelges cooleyi]|uniref:metalloendopeptidase OMA1, mitochondrial-like n=1 Tax=Adelges cooleyi TaxID=133065 RepID=UPI0021809292|nr:metalloendopeptidase OMA1, mitochondrial-like [Adelges cooleyi]
MAALAASVDFYKRHTVVDPYTGCAIFSLCSDRDLREVNDGVTKIMLREFGPLVSPKDEKLVEIINTIVSLIVKANPTVTSHIPWKVFVVDEPDENACTLPDGSMFFFRGLLSDMTKSVGQLSFVVGHEMAHCILRHQTEMISQQRCANVTKLLPLTVAYACTSDFNEMFVELMCSTVYSLAFELPLSRSKELEADIYGQKLMAAVGLDHNEANDVLAKFSRDESVVDEFLWWMSTHPLSDVRCRNLLKHKAQVDLISKANSCDVRKQKLKLTMPCSIV